MNFAANGEKWTRVGVAYRRTKRRMNLIPHKRFECVRVRFGGDLTKQFFGVHSIRCRTEMLALTQTFVQTMHRWRIEIILLWSSVFFVHILCMLCIIVWRPEISCTAFYFENFNSYFALQRKRRHTIKFNWCLNIKLTTN